jgi:energy-converting hydrogenase Eha subunit B
MNQIGSRTLVEGVTFGVMIMALGLAVVTAVTMLADPQACSATPGFAGVLWALIVTTIISIFGVVTLWVSDKLASG